MARILVVDDDPGIQRIIGRILHADGHETVIAADGTTALALAQDQDFHLVILDIGLPGTNGLDVAKTIHASSDTPIMFLTGHSSEQDILVGLAFGADEYITKPFSPPILAAKVRALLRRMFRQPEAAAPPAAAAGVVRVGTLTVDATRWRVEVAGDEVKLRTREFRLLQYLVSHQGLVHTRDALLQRVWGDDFDGTDRVVDVCLSRLRRQLFDHAACPVTVKAIPSVGYRLVAKDDAGA
jgi:DNA-binding response OmpR family regulator